MNSNTNKKTCHIFIIFTIFGIYTFDVNFCNIYKASYIGSPVPPMKTCHNADLLCVPKRKRSVSKWFRVFLRAKMHLQGQITEFDYSVVSLWVFLADKFSLNTRSHMVVTKVPGFPGVLKSRRLGWDTTSLMSSVFSRC